MYWDVLLVKPLADYRLYVEIEDGRKGIFDMTPYLDHGEFQELRNVSYINQAGIVLGAVTWPHEQDIAPETLLDEMQPVESLVDVPVQHSAAASYRGSFANRSRNPIGLSGHSEAGMVVLDGLQGERGWVNHSPHRRFTLKFAPSMVVVPAPSRRKTVNPVRPGREQR